MLWFVLWFVFFCHWSLVFLKKNGFFKDTFFYNNSGIVLDDNGTRFVKERITVPSNDKYNNDNREAI